MNNKKKIIKETVKRHIPQRHLASIRILYRMSMETIYGIKRTGLINIAIVAAMAAILTIFGALFRTSFSLSSFVDKLGDALEISVYLKPNTDPIYIKSRLNEVEHVEKITIITTEQAWEDMNKDMDEEYKKQEEIYCFLKAHLQKSLKKHLNSGQTFL